jgi:hypothetical protein
VGILDGIDPTTAGILSAAFQGLQASGPSRMPMGLGQIIGQAGSAGMGTYGSTLEAQRKAAATQALIDLEKQKGNLTEMQVKQLMRSQSIADAFLQHFLGVQPAPAAGSPATVAPNSPIMPGGGLSMTPPQALAQGATQGDVGPTVTNAARIGAPAPAAPVASPEPFAGMNPNTRAAMALDFAMNQGKNAAGVYQKGTAPIAGREGGIYQPTAGGDFQLAPGFLQGEGQLRRLRQQIQNENEIVTVKLPNGRLERMTKAQEIQMVQPHTVVPERGPGGGVVTGPTTTGEAEQSARGRELATMERDIDTKAEQASLLKSRSQLIRQNLAGIDPNNLAGSKQKLGEWLQTLGAPPDKVEKLLGSPGDYQAIQKQAIAMAFEQVRQLSARPAVQEVIFAMKSNPNIEMQPQGLVKIMNAVDGLANYNIAMSTAKEQWKQSHMGSMEGFVASWTRNHPVSEFVNLKELRTKSNIYTPTAAGPVTMRPVGSGFPDASAIDAELARRAAASGR